MVKLLSIHKDVTYKKHLKCGAVAVFSKLTKRATVMSSVILDEALNTLNVESKLSCHRSSDVLNECQSFCLGYYRTDGALAVYIIGTAHYKSNCLTTIGFLAFKL